MLELKWRSTVAYKAFYNRLARPGFAEFMKQMFARLVARLGMRILEPEGLAAVARFKDIVIQDGSSFAVKKKLEGVFPGRFTTIELALPPAPAHGMPRLTSNSGTAATGTGSVPNTCPGGPIGAFIFDVVGSGTSRPV